MYRHVRIDMCIDMCVEWAVTMPVSVERHTLPTTADCPPARMHASARTRYGVAPIIHIVVAGSSLSADPAARPRGPPVPWNMCIDMRIDVCLDMSAGVRADTRIDMCRDVCCRWVSVGF